jgi:peptidoglycan-associated lipoprotein
MQIRRVSTPLVARPVTPPANQSDPTASRGMPTPPEPVPEPGGVPPEPRIEDPLKVSDIDKINQNSPFQPIFFAYDSSEIDGDGQQTLNSNAGILKKYPEWVITIEGHADERTYLISLGIPADRLRTVSYGKEFPFDPTHNEAGWSKNRRAHFVLTSK